MPSVSELEPGLYGALVTDELASQLESLERLTPEQRDLNAEGFCGQCDPNDQQLRPLDPDLYDHLAAMVAEA